ncbi:hypothetical protein ABIE78_000950 [Sinorhizobium fredii]|uniref:DUF6731 family protein n=1 Tax=Rhizobium fredii TaxID=380 RepID=UPI001181966B|nr:DUF6731 family protein [Sinorhizobium fredii]
MDRQVTARFFGVSALNNDNATFYEALTRLIDDETRTQWTALYGDVRVKLARCAFADNDRRFIEGEFVRQQRHHVPPIALDDGELVDQPNPVGHRTAFRYDGHLGIILLESRKEAVPAGRIDQYMRRKIAGHRGFHFMPCLSRTGLEQLRDRHARAISFRVHSPTDLSLVEGQNSSIGRNLEALSNNFGGPSIEVRVYWPGHERGGRLNMPAVRNLIGLGTRNEGVFDKIEVKLADDQHPIDILTDQIRNTETLDLRNEVEHNWQTRQEFLERTFAANLPTLERIYGHGGADGE